MKYFGILLISVVGLVAADTFADYYPKAFYTIDANGNPTPVRPISANILNRVRRQIQPFQPFGFQQGFPNFPAIQPGQGQGSFVSSSQTLNSRFGEDEPIVTGQSTVVHHNNGQYHQVNTNLRPDGTVTSNKYSGRVKRQQNQMQSQDGQGGNQLQSQSQNQPQGQQTQLQSQGPSHGQGSTTNPAQGSAPVDNSQFNPQGNNQGNQGNQQQPYNAQGDNRNPQGQQGQQEYQQGQQGQQGQGQQGQGQQGQQGQQGYQQGQQGQPGYQQGQQGYQQGNQFPFASPFGIGAFGQQGFPQQFGGQQGFGPGFGFAPFPNFQQPGFGGNFGPPQGQGFAPGPGSQTIQTGGGLHSRFSDDDDIPSGTSGGTTTFTGRNGVFHSTSSHQGADGKVHTQHHSGRNY